MVGKCIEGVGECVWCAGAVPVARCSVKCGRVWGVANSLSDSGTQEAFRKSKKIPLVTAVRLDPNRKPCTLSLVPCIVLYFDP